MKWQMVSLAMKKLTDSKNKTPKENQFPGVIVERRSKNMLRARATGSLL